MTTTTSRRTFMGTSAAFALGTVMGQRFSRDCFAQPATPLKVRSDVTSLDPDGAEIVALKAGIQAMKDRSQTNANDPTGWHQQALIHQDHCPHGNWFFLPWHRAYLYYFERICRQASGNLNFTLPYWNWTTSRRLPAVFWGGATNPLFHANRAIGPSSQASIFSVGQQVIDNILAIADFQTFASFKPNPVQQRRFAGYGELEGTPHNHIHVFVGGDMASFMSPLDPCFWLHHANVDRLWAEWIEAHPNGNINDPQWRDFNFANNFVDTQGKPIVEAKVESTLSTYQMGYRYDTQSPIAPSAVAPLASITEPLNTFAEERVVSVDGTKPLSVPLALRNRLDERVAFVAGNSMADIARQKGVSPTVRLTIGGVVPPKDTNVIVRVFINCPYLSDKTSPHDRHYVGSFCFFEHVGHDERDHKKPKKGGKKPDNDHHGPKTFSFDITYAIQWLQSAKELKLDQPLQVQLVAVPIHGKALYREKIRATKYSLSYIETPIPK